MPPKRKTRGTTKKEPINEHTSADSNNESENFMNNKVGVKGSRNLADATETLRRSSRTPTLYSGRSSSPRAVKSVADAQGVATRRMSARGKPVSADKQADSESKQSTSSSDDEKSDEDDQSNEQSSDGLEDENSEGQEKKIKDKDQEDVEKPASAPVRLASLSGASSALKSRDAQDSKNETRYPRRQPKPREFLSDEQAFTANQESSSDSGGTESGTSNDKKDNSGNDHESCPESDSCSNDSSKAEGGTERTEHSSNTSSRTLRALRRNGELPPQRVNEMRGTADEPERGVRRSHRERKTVKRLLSETDNGQADKSGNSDQDDSETTLSNARCSRRGRRRRGRSGTRGGDRHRFPRYTIYPRCNSDDLEEHRRSKSPRRVSAGSTDSTSEDAEFASKEARRKERDRHAIQPIGGSKILEKATSAGLLADIDPLALVWHDLILFCFVLASYDCSVFQDTNVRWDAIGGLGSHVKTLHEMVVLPLLYPELFARFSVTPPRGVLFHGPPGTGKTLVARALANTCSLPGKPVAFFMRKGADCLSKWVGEAERQLRLLFEQATKMQPSIIFFDEIDGLAPVRSARQDQIHASIVSTLLALMDGLDSRGKVIVIGATNRVDSIDPALRRPGRFDRELLFALPSLQARSEILKIHTKSWNPSLPESLINELASKSAGYCGADLKALCTEASLLAMRRAFPQLYDLSNDISNSGLRFLVDPNQINIEAQDFALALENITPASHRSTLSFIKQLPINLAPLLGNAVSKIAQLSAAIFPLGAKSKSQQASAGDIRDHCVAMKPLLPFRPRLLIDGLPGSGQHHVGAAVLHLFENYPMASLDLPSVLGDAQCKSPEETCLRIFRELRRNAPAVLYWPMVVLWWETAEAALRASLQMLIENIPDDVPIFLIATSELPHEDMCDELKSIFQPSFSARYEIPRPTEAEVEAFFSPLVDLINQPISFPMTTPLSELPSLPLVPISNEESKQENLEISLSEAARADLAREDEIVLATLRLRLRGVLDRLLKVFKSFEFMEEDKCNEKYGEVILQPLTLSAIQRKLNERKYNCVGQFLADIDLIVQNVKELARYSSLENSPRVNKAYHLQDTALTLVASEVEPKVARRCQEIASRLGTRTCLNQLPSQTSQQSETEQPDQMSLTSVCPTSDIPKTSGNPATNSRILESEQDTKLGENNGIVTANQTNGISASNNAPAGISCVRKIGTTKRQRVGESAPSFSSSLLSISSDSNPGSFATNSSSIIKQSVKIDTADLRRIFQSLLNISKYYTLDQLEVLHHKLNFCISSHSSNVDKSRCLLELKELLSTIDSQI